MTRDPDPARRGPWREPMLWLVVGLPAVVVVAGFITLWLSISSGGNDAVADKVRRTAQVQTTELAPDEAAAARGLSAVLSLQPRQAVLVPVTGDFDRAAELRLRLSHPARADRDLQLVLQPTDTGWAADAEIPAGNDWSATVQDAGGRWRIVGRLQAGQRAVRLAPALPAQ